jgi:hypothetical protein
VCDKGLIAASIFLDKEEKNYRPHKHNQLIPTTLIKKAKIKYSETFRSSDNVLPRDPAAPDFIIVSVIPAAKALIREKTGAIQDGILNVWSLAHLKI